MLAARVLLAVSLVVGVWQFVRSAGRPFLDRLVLGSLPLCAVVVAACFAERLVAGPYWDWNAARLTISFALVQGYELYPSPTEGATLASIYGPIFAVAFLPTTLCDSPTMAILLGIGLSMMYFFLPVIGFHLRGGQACGAWAMLGFICFSLMVLEDEGLRYSAFSLHPDGPTLGMLSAASLVLLGSGPSTSTTRLLAAGLLAGLAVWCKQPAAPIFVALLAWIWVTEGRRAGVRGIAAFSSVGVLLTAGLLIAFGVQDLVFNMFIVPNAVPWDLNGTNRWGALWVEFGELVRKGRPFVLMIVVGVILTAPRVPTVSGVRSWLRGRSWVLLTLIGMAMIPTSLLGAVKAGGGSNSFSFMTYFLAVAGTTVLVDAARCPNSLRSRIAKGTLIALGVGLAAHLSSDTSVFDRGWERFRQLDENPQQVAHNFLVVHPGTAYFPWNPLAHLMVEGKLYHMEYGVNERTISGLRMSTEQFRAHIPSRMRVLAFQADRQSEWTRRDYLTEFDRRVDVDGLPGWIVYTDGGETDR